MLDALFGEDPRWKGSSSRTWPKCSLPLLVFVHLILSPMETLAWLSALADMSSESTYAQRISSCTIWAEGYRGYD